MHMGESRKRMLKEGGIEGIKYETSSGALPEKYDTCYKFS